MISLIAAAAMASAIDVSVCTNLSNISLENASITTSEVIPEGVFTPPNGNGPPGANQNPEAIPEHCRVTMVLTPTPDSLINIELWMPMENWNGKFMAMGNGGWAGAIQGYGDMQTALRRGYAAAATDNGHSAADGPAGMFALGHPEKIVDFAYRSVHDMTVKAKRVINNFYSQPIDYAYFKGCSTGGRQAVMAAQRYPGDFDGIIAGALANRHIHMHTAGAYRSIDLSRNSGKAIPEVTAAMVNEAVMAQCDILGEGFLNNPQQCSFDLSSLQCATGENAESCLSAEQLELAEEFYGGLKNSAGELIFSGQILGNPLPTLTSTNEAPGPFAFDSVRILGFQDENYDWRDFDLDRDMPIIDQAAGFVDSVDPDLQAFQAHGGKLLLYAGWRDTIITPKNTILYYDSVLEEMGAAQEDWLRLFMVPGMGHCSGGDGPYSFDSITALEQWREAGIMPSEIMANNPNSGLTRPLCTYPSSSEYAGSGDINDSANWSCQAP